MARTKQCVLLSGEEESLAVRLTVEPGFTKASRWTLQPQAEQRLLHKCYADEEGEIACTLHFPVVGDPQTFLLAAKATCSLPRLLNFPEGCFEHAIEERPLQCAIKKTYISSEVYLCFKLYVSIYNLPRITRQLLKTIAENDSYSVAHTKLRATWRSCKASSDTWVITMLFLARTTSTSCSFFCWYSRTHNWMGLEAADETLTLGEPEPPAR